MASDTSQFVDQPDIKTVRMSRNYFCVDCKCSTRNPRLYLEHRRDYHKDPISIHGCDLCVYASKHSQKLTRHLRTVHRDVIQGTANQSDRTTFGQLFETIPENMQGAKNTRLSTCKLCGLYTSSKSVLMDHVQAQHPEVRIYKCDQCEYSHYIRDRFNRHHRYHSMSHIQCKLCEFQTIYRWNLERHMRHHVDNISMGFRCNKCNFTASTKQSITAHEIAHHSGLNLQIKSHDTLQIDEMSEVTHLAPDMQLRQNHHVNKETNDESDFDASDYLEVVFDGDANTKIETNTLAVQSVNIKPESALEMQQHKHINKIKFFHCINCNFRNEINWCDSTADVSPNLYLRVKSSEQLLPNSRYRCGYCHQMSNWKHVIERHCRLVHNTSALIEKYSEDEQLFQCFNPIKRRLDVCSETVTTLKKKTPDNFDDKNVTHVDHLENMPNSSKDFK